MSWSLEWEWRALGGACASSQVEVVQIPAREQVQVVKVQPAVWPEGRSPVFPVSALSTADDLQENAGCFQGL